MKTRIELAARHEQLRSEIREFCEQEIEPEIAAHERDGRFPEALARSLGTRGYVGIPFPDAIGGAGKDYRSFAIVLEELARSWKLLAGTVNVACGLVGYPIQEFGADWQREEWLGSICEGTWIPAFALTESEAGSDAASLETTAERDGDELVLNGRKIWTTNGSIADFLLVAVQTSAETEGQGISLVGVPDPAGRAGLEFVRDIPCMEGETAIESELRFEDVRVPARNVVGETGHGFRYLMEGLDIGRLGTAAQGVGISQGAFEASRSFADEREQFGQPIREFQGIGFKLADMNTKTEAARLLTLSAADSRDRGERITQAAAMAKTFATDAAMEIATEAVQVHGARGYSRDYQVERYMREAKGTQIYDGTNEINRLVIANRMYE